MNSFKGNIQSDLDVTCRAAIRLLTEEVKKIPDRRVGGIAVERWQERRLIGIRDSAWSCGHGMAALRQSLELVESALDSAGLS